MSVIYVNLEIQREARVLDLQETHHRLWIYAPKGVVGKHHTHR